VKLNDELGSDADHPLHLVCLAHLFKGKVKLSLSLHVKYPSKKSANLSPYVTWWRNVSGKIGIKDKFLFPSRSCETRVMVNITTLPLGNYIIKSFFCQVSRFVQLMELGTGLLYCLISTNAPRLKVERNNMPVIAIASLIFFSLGLASTRLLIDQ